jgi:hypothetical protein
VRPCDYLAHYPSCHVQRHKSHQSIPCSLRPCAVSITIDQNSGPALGGQDDVGLSACIICHTNRIQVRHVKNTALFWLLLTLLTGSGESELAMFYTIIALLIAFSTRHSTFN